SFGDWRMDVGLIDIGSELSGLSYETAIESDAFIGAKFKLNALDNKKVTLEAKYILRNQPEGLTSDYDGDGSTLSLVAIWDKKINIINTQFTGGYDMNDSKGMYQDNSMLNLGASGFYSINEMLMMGGGLKYKQITYKETDPLKGTKENSTITTLSINGSYRNPLFYGIIFVGDITQKQKSSNVDNLRYSTQTITISGVYIF
ncbi:hypothetical protein KKA14_08145, partial [bacterium]|nr:hypothetical protein [bacterium]